jgi:hypothetical protein
MAGGGITLLTFLHGPGQVEDFFGRTPTDVWDVTIASGTYPANGYTLDPANLGQLNRFKVITEVYFSPKTTATLGVLWEYDIANKSMRGYQQGAGAGALTELTGTVGPFQLRCRFYGF